MSYADTLFNKEWKQLSAQGELCTGISNSVLKSKPKVTLLQLGAGPPARTQARQVVGVSVPLGLRWPFELSWRICSLNRCECEMYECLRTESWELKSLSICYSNPTNFMFCDNEWGDSVLVTPCKFPPWQFMSKFKLQGDREIGVKKW